jgi:hypothetical protein
VRHLAQKQVAGRAAALVEHNLLRNGHDLRDVPR